MTLNRIALTLGAGPRGVQEARRWVVSTCHDIGREELAESAELGVSELVTNALLHGEQPIQVRIRGTQDHPRVEVRDASTEPPALPSVLSAELDLDAFDLDSFDDHTGGGWGRGDEGALLTFGRGLSIVARSSVAWGADVDDDGKVVWFEPSAEGDLDGVEGVLTGVVDPPPAPRAPEADLVPVVVLGVPVKLYVGFQRHFRELRREVRLLALAHESDYPLAKSLSDMFGSLERELRDGLGAAQMAAAVASGAAEVDLHVDLPRASARVIGRFLELLDLADAFCREERLLSLARSPEQRRFQTWFLDEFVRQNEGVPPSAWSERHTPGRRSSVS